MDHRLQHFLERSLQYLANPSATCIRTGTECEQTRYCFDIYDLNDDGFISKEEMMTMMKNCMVKSGTQEEESDEGVKVDEYS